MIGMNKLKNSIVDQILYFIQEFHKVSNSKNDDFMHTVIYGPPGTGKTETAKIIGKIFSKLGILSKKYFKKVTRADLIAGYLGQTAIKTRDVIKEAKGGVLFIDEAYALGNSEKRDSFAKECIDTLCEGLSDNKDDLMVIIAGYEDELKNCFFAYNQGLDSRFTWRFNTDDYKYDELFLIFKKKVKDIGWKLHEKINKNWFEDKMDYFKFYGRDIETLLAKVKIAHGRRVFCLPKEKKLTITLRDLNKGYDMFLDNDEVKSRKDKSIKDILSHMYC
jgi:SpoVK/Ycf46/Vps4 family AAA+-type ATPase